MAPLTAIWIRTLHTILLLCVLQATVNAQPSVCPPNIDFRTGDFTNWECRYGIVQALGGQNVVSWFGTGQIGDRHMLIDPSNTETDSYGGFPKHCPNTTSYSVRLGNPISGHEAEGLFYTYTIPASSTRFSLLYNYAIVLQNPSHQPYEQPRFRSRIIDVATETEIDCVSFDFSSSGSLSGFQPTLIGGGVYKDWTPVSIDLSAYAGKTIRIEFITSDCVFQQHFGYAYISVSSNCNGSITGNFYCQGDTSISLKAPYGFAQYSWYSNDSFTQEISTAQGLDLTASATPVGSVFPVIVTPFPGYGCLDTLYAVIGSAVKPVSRAGPDVSNCSKKPVQLGTSPTDDYEYLWNNANMLNSAYIANPSTHPVIVVPTEFIVKTTDLSSGCFSSDTVIVNPVVLDTLSAASGKTIYCPDETIQASLNVFNTAAQVQWFKGTSPISGATSAVFRPSTVGTYWAELKQSGCTDSTRLYTLRQAPFAKANFTSNKEIQCLNQPISFTNKTTIPSNEPVSYSWRFSDGANALSVDAKKAFATIGTHAATLIARSGTDCLDSITKTVSIITSCVPIMPTAFTPNKDGKNDDLKPFLVGGKSLKRFTVYNRYGNIVFTTAKEGEGWNGLFNGKPLQTDVFVWVIEYIANNDKTVVEKGTVTLIQ